MSASKKPRRRKSRMRPGYYVKLSAQRPRDVEINTMLDELKRRGIKVNISDVQRAQLHAWLQAFLATGEMPSTSVVGMSAMMAMVPQLPAGSNGNGNGHHAPEPEDTGPQREDPDDELVRSILNLDLDYS